MAPIFAPFTADGSLNLKVVKTYAAHLKKEGVAGVWVNGSVGEGMSLTVQERKALAEAWLACREDVPTVIVHCGAVCLKDALELARHAEDHRASGVAVVPPLYDRPATTDDLVDYMQEVAKACPRTPLFYYHYPSKTGVNLSMSEFLQKGVKRIPTLAGMKFTDEDVSDEGRKCVQVDGGSLTIFSGFDQDSAVGGWGETGVGLGGLERQSTLQEALSVGFSCSVNAGFNFVSHLGARVYSLMAAGDVHEAKKVQKQFNDCFDVILSPDVYELTLMVPSPAVGL
ncbi:N-acetylneuraminate lyase [Chionoecetes opilio]|uniref:N-acetylneuraminate lyase n=1 Tax=Chionoecetes opilio TaxID=41210 RepID=A0A8J4YJB0_CHIOP|nr:N-acetylneuraminate lyase [Chionoecetes opilio]